MQNNLSKTITHSDLAEFPMGGTNDGENGIVNLGEMIDGGINFKVIYNALLRIGVDQSNTIMPESIDTEDPFFTHGQKAQMIMVNNQSGESGNLKYNMAKGTISGSSILSKCPIGISSGATPVLTHLFCDNGVTTSQYETEEDIYYFIPSITTSTPAWIAVGVKSTCWSHDDMSKDRWIIGKRMLIARNYNYIFKVSKSTIGKLSAGYIWIKYTYDNGGANTGKTIITMDGNTLDDYASTLLDKTSSVTINSAHNRLSGNFFDIINSLNSYDWGVNNSNRKCTCFHCPCRGNTGTSSVITSIHGNLHVTPHAYTGTSSVGYWNGTNRPFGLYRHITYVDLNGVYSNTTLNFESMILYPGMIEAKSPGNSAAYLTQGAILDLNTKIGTTQSAITTINQYNQFIKLTEIPSSNKGGRIMYIIPHFNIPMDPVVYINTPSTTLPYWNCSASAPAIDRISSLGTLSSGNAYIIECWNASSSKTYAKMYTYDADGQCIAVSDTISCKYTTV